MQVMHLGCRFLVFVPSAITEKERPEKGLNYVVYSSWIHYNDCIVRFKLLLETPPLSAGSYPMIPESLWGDSWGNSSAAVPHTAREGPINQVALIADSRPAKSVCVL